MIAVFHNTSNVYRPQWHPDAPTLARPGLLATVSPVPRRTPERTLAPWFEWSWRMGEPWLAHRRPPIAVTGKVGLPTPPPGPPVSTIPWFHPNFTMDAPWLTHRNIKRTVPGAVGLPIPAMRSLINQAPWFAVAWEMSAPWIVVNVPKTIPTSSAPALPPPTVAPSLNFSTWFQPWTLQSPWRVPAPMLLRDASVPPTLAPARTLSTLFQPDWTMDAAWLVQRLALQIPPSGGAVPPPPTRPPDRNWLTAVEPPWTLQSPWRVPAPRLLRDASVPPTLAPASNRSTLFAPDWTMDAAWLWGKIVWQIPPSPLVLVPLIPELILPASMRLFMVPVSARLFVVPASVRAYRLEALIRLYVLRAKK